MSREAWTGRASAKAKQVLVRLSADEWRTLASEARHEGSTVAEVLRSAGLARATRKASARASAKAGES